MVGIKARAGWWPTWLLMLVALGPFAAVQVAVQLTMRSPSRGFDIGFDTPARGLELALDVASVVGLFALVVSVAFASVEIWARWRRLMTLAAAAFLTWLPAIVFGKAWTGMAGYFAGLALMLLYGWAGWALFAGGLGGVILASMMRQFSGYDIASLLSSSLVLGMVIFGLTRLLQIVRYTDVVGGEIARLAVSNERTRFAQDLHDLLGYGLSAIILKAEFAKRLIDSDPARACDELTEVLDLARRAAADVREVANGYRSISLAKEAASVSSLLTAVGINAQVDVDCGALGDKVDTVLATVLREAVTNAIWHSAPQNCIIEARVVEDSVCLTVSNDCVSPVTADHRGGAGLPNLQARLGTIGGSLTTGISDGWYVMVAKAPLASLRDKRDSGSRLRWTSLHARVSSDGKPGQDPAENVHLHPVP